MMSKISMGSLSIIIAVTLGLLVSGLTTGQLIGGGGTANPAAVKCTDEGYDYQNGDCIFPDGSSCDAWDFYNGKCGYSPAPEPTPEPTPAPTPAPAPTPQPEPEPFVGPVIGGKGTANPAAVKCTDQGYDYQNGDCIFPDGSSCDAWDFYNGKCSYNPQPVIGPGGENPASVYCVQQGGTVQIQQTEQGEVGICVFPDGSSCEEWAYYNGECTPKPPKPVGVGGTRHFTFRAVGVGETDLVFRLKGPDGSVQQERTFHIVVVE